MKMSKLITGLCLALAVGSAHAEPSTNVAWTPALYKLVKSGDAALGAKLETVETEDALPCMDCHGKAGAEPDRDKHPMIAGQLAAYTFKQLKDYKDGKRENRRMQDAVAALSDEDMAALSVYYADQPFPKPEVDEDDTVSKETLDLVYRGDKTRLIQPCAACHGERGQGARMDVPALVGQNVKYFVNTMKDYAKGKRGNDTYSRMRIIANSLTRDEINELAVYYARLGHEPQRRGIVDQWLAWLWGH
ncbi:MAG: c-type cytochrome [Gammaproteobacteria bacterium]